MDALVVVSTIKKKLSEATGLTVSRDAVEWVNAQTCLAVGLCASLGRRTPVGRLMAPPKAKASQIESWRQAHALLKRMVDRLPADSPRRECQDFKDAVAILAAGE